MRVRVRFSLLAIVVGALAPLSASAAAQAAFGVPSHGWFAANCKEGFPTCGQKAVEKNEEPTKGEAEEQGYTQAAGHPPFGITDFKLNSVQIQTTPFPAFAPVENLKNLRVDVGPGVSTNPEAVVKCSLANFTGEEKEVGGQKVFTAPSCPESEIGENIVTTVVPIGGGVFADVELTGKVYNLEQTKGLSSLFGVALNLEPLLKVKVFSHTFIEGNVEWGKQAIGTGKGDYHDIFEIKNIAAGLLKSRLIFFGNKGNTGKGAFISNPTSCTGIGPQTTTRWRGESEKGVVATAAYTTAVGTENCGPLVPFLPGFALSAETTQSDVGDGITTTVSLPHDPNPEHLDSSDLNTAVVTLPEGMTLNPSAAAGLTACSPAEARIHSETKGVGCLESAKMGTVELNVPGLPPGSLKGNIYLGGPESGPITGPPYIIYLDAESERYGISVRLKGEAAPNPVTGQVTTTFSENPEQPFSEAILHFKGGALAPIANPLTCGAATATTLLTPFTTGVSSRSPSSSVTIDSNGKGGACSSPLAFSPAQATSVAPATAGSHSNFTFNLERGEGQQYLSKVSTILPAGLVGLVPTVGQCSEAQAIANACPENSLIGSVSAIAGSGPTPFTFPGKAYFTGSIKGAPYGMAFVVPTEAGPFSLGNAITFAKINVDQGTGRVIVTSELPTIVAGGIPVRLRKLSVTVNRQGFLINPTNCGVLATESTVTGLIGTTIGSPGASLGTPVNLSTPFQVSGCNSLSFKPSWKVAMAAKISKANGASLETTLNMPGGSANVKSILVTLPKQLPSRLTTLQKACPEATFAANPYTCPPGSFVGGVRANTPVLPQKLKGPAILVSHGGRAFPDLDLLLEAPAIRVILTGNTDIKNGITTNTFASTPDVPVSSITVNLPVGPYSALAGNGNFCTTPLVMPTTITGQNGVVFKQNTKIRVTSCPVTIVGQKVVGSTAYVTVKTPASGRISGSGSGLATVFRHLSHASDAATLRVRLSGAGRRRGRPFSVRLRVGYVPSSRSVGISIAYTTVTFR